jgi:ubiquinone/menaquinone biosynthesis C-methylase UbiE
MIKQIIYRLVHKLDYCLQKELKDCDTVLDLGCGPSSPLKNCKNIKFSLGVEAFKPYLNISKKQKIHTQYLQKNILSLDLPKNSFDAVILIEVLEHLTKKDGLKILKLANKWAKKKIIISTPNKYFPMNSVDQNSYQKHLSGWDISELKSFGFKCYGVSGLKSFYSSQNQVDSLIKNKYYQNIRFYPQKLFYLLNGFFQIFIYYFPSLAFGLFAVKNKNE